MQDIAEILAQAVVAARALLLILDLVDNYIPALKRVSDVLGTILGGRKQRFGGE